MSIDTSTKTEYSHIAYTPGLAAGEACVADHRIRVRDIAAARDLGGLTPEEIAAGVYPDLTLAEVYSALAYYEDHREEIDAEHVKESRFVEDFLRQHPKLARDLRPERT